MNNYIHGGIWVSQSRFSPILYLLNCQHTWLTASTCSIGIGRCRDDSDLADLIITANINLDITVSGVGGLDTGVEAVSTWYYVYVIADSTGTNPIAGLISASPTAPTMPTGYNLKRRVGSMYNDANGNLREWIQYWTNRDKFYLWQFDQCFVERILIGGSALPMTNVSCAVYMPPTSKTAYINAITYTGGNSRRSHFARGSSITTTPTTRCFLSNTSIGQFFFFMITDTNNNISYNVSTIAESADIICGGYIDELN